jgi:hypothetical protein
MGHGTVGGLDYVGTYDFIGSAATALGTYALQGANGGTNLIGIGQYTARLLNCYLVGSGARSSNTIAIGANIGFNGLGQAQDSTLIGTGILYNSGSYTTVSGSIQTTSTLSNVPQCSVVGSQALQNATSGNHSIVGFNAFNLLTSGINQTGIGLGVGLNLTTGGNSFYGGYQAGQNFVIGNQNVIIGSGAANSGMIATGTLSDGGGVNAGNVLAVSGILNGANIFVGQVIYVPGIGNLTVVSFGTGTGHNGTYNMSGSGLANAVTITDSDFSNVVCLGFNTNPTANNQIFIGNSSITSILMGGAGSPLINVSLNNVGIGNAALHSITTGLHNAAYGYNSSALLSTGQQNTSMGHGSLATAATAYNNTAIGFNALNIATAGTNTAIGSNTGLNLVGSTGAVIIGYNAGGGMVNAVNSVAIGNGAGATGDWVNSMALGNGANCTANNQIVMGNASVLNAYIGPPGVNQILQVGVNNQGIGAGALGNATGVSGLQLSVGIGTNALAALTTGVLNVAVGKGALAALTTNGYSAAVGALALNSATGVANTGIGYAAGSNIVAGTGNLLAGYQAGQGLVTATNSICIGPNSQNTGDYSNVINISSNQNATGANQILIGSATQSVSLAGSLTIASGATGAAVFGGSLAAASFVGQTAGTAVAAGSIGELVKSDVPGGSAVTLTTATAANVTSITLTAGDWDVWGAVAYSPSAGMSVVQGAVTASSATYPAYPSTGAGGKFLLAATFTSGASQMIAVSPTQFLITPAMVTGGTNVVYLVAAATFGGTCTAWGHINARRRS